MLLQSPVILTDERPKHEMAGCNIRDLAAES